MNNSQKAIRGLSILDKQIVEEFIKGKLQAPLPKRQAVDHLKDKLDVSERRACGVVGQHHSTQGRLPTPRSDHANLNQVVITWAEKHGGYGYPRITAVLNREGGRVSVGRVYRVWRRDGGGETKAPGELLPTDD